MEGVKIDRAEVIVTGSLNTDSVFSVAIQGVRTQRREKESKTYKHCKVKVYSSFMIYSATTGGSRRHNLHYDCVK